MLPLLRCGLAVLFFATPLLGFAHGGHDHGAAPGESHAARMQRVWDQMRAPRPQLGISVTTDPQGKLWLARVDNGHLLVSHSSDSGKQWSTPVKANPAPESILGENESRPKIQSDGQRVYVSWTQNLNRPFAGAVRLAVSTDGGQSFTAPRTVHSDTQEIAHAFDALLLDPRGRLTLVWLDKREHAKAKAAGQPYTGTAVYTAYSDDGGQSFSPERKLADHSCECCRLALTASRERGPLLMWRHVFGKNTRDFALLAVEGGGKPRRITDDDWQLDGCPHRGGSLAADGQGRLHAVWFTLGQKRQGLFYRSFSETGEQASHPLPVGRHERQASHPTLHAAGRNVAIAWLEFDGQRQLLTAMRSTDGGQQWSAPATLAEASGAVDYPHWVSLGGVLHVVWHTAERGIEVLAWP